MFPILKQNCCLKKKIPKINIITPNLAAALDRANVSNRNATYILAATLQSVGIDLRNVNLSYKTIQRNRILLRKEIAEGLKKDLKFNDNYVVHWDGKLLSDIVGADVVDRLPILLTSSGAEQLLGIQKIGAGTGIEQASAVNSTLKHWGVSDYVKAVCFDTAYTNTGIHRGAGVELENLLGRKLIWLPCRHHVIELLIKGVFEVYWPTQNGPNVSIFGRFKNNWNKIDKSKYSAGINDPIVAKVLSEKKDETLDFIESYSLKYLPRNDYREFLELSSIFLGVIPKDNFTFKHPGAMSHARWMSKVIYCLKIYIFRGEFKLTPHELTSIRQVCIFIIVIYIKAWFTSPSAILAANNDLILMQQLILYDKINSSVSKGALKKMSDHLWYLSDKLAIISLFDDAVDPEVKKKMVKNLKNRNPIKTKARKYEFDYKNLHEFLHKD
ncbi:uncharacterized protein LOC123262280 isoform X2 [Cotesia glomerata]|nr:uncharacterized protein LOC123262280 isoform X2 [Cotesia glomerata]